jgi:hypothetical protein
MKTNGTIKKCTRESSTEKKFLITNSIDNKILDVFSLLYNSNKRWNSKICLWHTQASSLEFCIFTTDLNNTIYVTNKTSRLIVDNISKYKVQ